MTIKDIARMAGVSVSTVSRVLNQHPDVSAPIRTRVMQVVEEQHFIPNSAARNLVRPRCNTIGVVCRETENCVYGPVIVAIQEELEKLGWAFCLRQVVGSRDELNCAAELERAEKLKGLILLGGRGDYTAAETAALNVPFVCCAFDLPFGELRPEEYSSVCVDDRAAACHAVEYLASLGHREIAYLSCSVTDHAAGELRYQGYRAAQAALSLPSRPEQLTLCDGSELRLAYDAVRALENSGERFTALLAHSDRLAVAAIKAIRDSGRRVPEDCSVMGLDGVELTGYTVPVLTALVQPRRELGRESVRMLADQIENRSLHRHILLQPTLRRGESAAVCPR